MKCPHCKTDLVITGQARLETLSEHVCDPNGTPSMKDVYRCPNDLCPCHGKFSWNSDGDFYSSCEGLYTNPDEIFQDGMFSAYGSIARQLDVEVYGKTLPKTKYLHPAWMLWFFAPFIEYHATADFDGNIVKKWWTMGILKKDRSSGRYRIGAHFCWHTWKFLWKTFQRHLRRGNLKKAFEPSSNRAWVYRWFEIFISIVYYKTKAKYHDQIDH